MLELILAVVGGIMVGLLLALLYSRLKKKEYAGTINVMLGDARQIFQLEIDMEPDDLDSRDEVLFRIRKVSDV